MHICILYLQHNLPFSPPSSLSLSSSGTTQLAQYKMDVVANESVVATGLNYNYTSRKFQVKVILKALNLYEIISEEIPMATTWSIIQNLVQ